MGFWDQLWPGIAANGLFVAGLTLLGLLYVQTAGWFKLKQLYELLGIDKATMKVNIKVARIFVKQEGTLGVRTGRPGVYGFYGSVMNEIEYVFAQHLSERIRSKPRARVFGALLDQVGLSDAGRNPLHCEIELGPEYVETGTTGADYEPPDYQDENNPATVRVNNAVRDSMNNDGVYVLAGGPVYNAAVQYALTRPATYRFRFDLPTTEKEDKRSIVVLSNGQGGPEKPYEEELSPREDEASYRYGHFVIQKISNFDQRRVTVIICSGLSGTGSAMAMYTLASKWRELRKEFGGRDFALLYRFETHLAPGKLMPESAKDVHVERKWPEPVMDGKKSRVE